MALSSEVVEELGNYRNSLQDLTVNSKPLINMLTMLAEEYEQHAGEIVRLIEDHIKKCKPTKKLPVLYLIDSIVKNLGSTSYKSLFMKNIVQTFTSVFEQLVAGRHDPSMFGAIATETDTSEMLGCSNN